MKLFCKQNKPEAKNIENNNNYNNNNNNNNNYSLILNLIKELKNKFCNAKFATLIKLVDNSYYNTNINLINDLENILFNNFFTTEINNKVDVIRIISENVIAESIDFDDKKWFDILKDFLNQRNINIEVYFSYIKVFVKLIEYINKKNENITAVFVFPFKFSKFLLEENSKYFNDNVKITSLNDIIVLLHNIKSKVIKIDLIADNIWLDVDAVVLNLKDDIPINFYCTMPVLIVNCQKHINLSKSSILFKNSIKALNTNLLTMIKDHRLLEEYNKKETKYFSSELIQYASLYFNNDNDFNNLFCLLKNTYLEELSSDIMNINWADHIWCLYQISQKKNIDVLESKEFWNQFFCNFKTFVKFQPTKFEIQIQNSNVKKFTYLYYPNPKILNISMNDTEYEILDNNFSAIFDEKLSYEIANIFTFFAFIIKLASRHHEVLDIIHWKFIMNMISFHTEFYNTKIYYNLLFIFAELNSVYSNPKLDSVWKEFVFIFNPKLQSTLLNKKDALMLIFSVFKNSNVSTSELNDIIKSIFFNSSTFNSTDICNNEYKNKEEEIRTKDKSNNVLCNEDEFSTNINKLSNTITTNIDYNSNNTKIENSIFAKVELFFAIYQILDDSISNNKQEINDKTKILANAFVDLLMLESKQMLGLNIKSIVENLKINSFDKFKENIIIKIKDYMDNNSKDNNILELATILYNGGIIEQLELTQLKQYY